MAQDVFPPNWQLILSLQTVSLPYFFFLFLSLSNQVNYCTGNMPVFSVDGQLMPSMFAFGFFSPMFTAASLGSDVLLN